MGEDDTGFRVTRFLGDRFWSATGGAGVAFRLCFGRSRTVCVCSCTRLGVRLCVFFGRGDGRCLAVRRRRRIWRRVGRGKARGERLLKMDSGRWYWVRPMRTCAPVDGIAVWRTGCVPVQARLWLTRS